MAAGDTEHKTALEYEEWKACKEEERKEFTDLLLHISDTEHTLHKALADTQRARAKLIQMVQRFDNMGNDKQKVLVYWKGQCYHSERCVKSGAAKTTPDAVTKTYAADILNMRPCTCKPCERAWADDERRARTADKDPTLDQ
jgi:hypothetical protein